MIEFLSGGEYSKVSIPLMVNSVTAVYICRSNSRFMVSLCPFCSSSPSSGGFLPLLVGPCTSMEGPFPSDGSFPLLDSDSDLDLDTDSYTMQILWERDPNLNLTQWKHALHNIM